MTDSAPRAGKVVTGYGDGGFRIAGERHEGSVIVFPERVDPWPVAAMADLTVSSLDGIIAAASEIEILLLGCGHEAPRLPQDVREALASRRIAVDVMNTGAACRTWNILLSEMRPAAAALIAVSQA